MKKISDWKKRDFSLFLQLKFYRTRSRGPHAEGKERAVIEDHTAREFFLGE
jgi:hypothetical protein